MVESISDIEHHRLAYALPGHNEGALPFLDQRAAFPSVSHDWMFFVLRSMGIPHHVLVALGHHYGNVRSQVCLMFRRYCWVVIGCGIKQLL